jgi:hypothetical protein
MFLNLFVILYFRLNNIYLKKKEKSYMKIKLNLKKKVVDMEHPKNNKTEEKEVVVSLNEPFEKDFNVDVFKVIKAGHNQIILEYDRHYTVKNEHKGYEYNTTFNLNESKEITSMWGKDQTTYKITFLGLEEKTLEQAINDNPADHFKENSFVRDNNYNSLDDVLKESDSNE